MASYALGHPTRRELKLDWLKLLSFGGCRILLPSSITVPRDQFMLRARLRVKLCISGLIHRIVLIQAFSVTLIFCYFYHKTHLLSWKVIPSQVVQRLSARVRTVREKSYKKESNNKRSIWSNQSIRSALQGKLLISKEIFRIQHKYNSSFVYTIHGYDCTIVMLIANSETKF